MLSEFDKAEMRVQYREAADKRKQIGILCDLYACSTSAVLDALGLDSEKAVEKKPQPYQQAKRNGSAKKSYSQAVKKDVVKDVLLKGLTQVAVAERYGIPFQTVGYWVTKAKKTQKQFMDAADEILSEQAAPVVALAAQKQRITQAAELLHNADGKRVPAAPNPEWEAAVDELAPEREAKQQLCVEPDFEAAVQKLDAQIAVQLRLNAIADAVTGLRNACHSLADTRLLEAPERDTLERLRVRATAFRAGMVYAMARRCSYDR